MCGMPIGYTGRNKGEAMSMWCRMAGLRWAWLLWAGLSVANGATAADDPPRNARDILSRPSRAQEEWQAWYPARTEALDTLLASGDPASLQSSSKAVRVPPGKVLGLIQWMDNRYVMVGVQTEGPDSQGEVQGTVSILDTTTAELYPYKPGRFICYRLGKILFETGPTLAFTRPDISGAKVWVGDVLQEQAHGPWFGNDASTARPYMPLRDTCAGLMDPQVWAQQDKDIGGVFSPEPHRADMPVWKRIGLLPEHGYFANHLPTLRKLPYGEMADAYAQIHWLRAGKENMALPLSFRYEVGQAGIFEWAPWIGRYVLSGAGVSYSEASAATRSAFTPSALRYGRDGNVVFFDPRDGSIRKMARPSQLTTEVQVKKAFATRGGLLWQSGTGKPWGLYLSRGSTVKKIADGRIARIAMSPNGCQAAVLSHQNPKAPGNINGLNIINFCKVGN